MSNIRDFCMGYQPMAYVIDGLVRAGYLYTMTASTGSGKTAFNVIAALAVATGREDILGREIEQGRVAYLVFENSDDVRMRFISAANRLSVDFDEIANAIEVLDIR